MTEHRQFADDDIPRSGAPWLGSDRPSARRPPALGDRGYQEAPTTLGAPAVLWAAPPPQSDDARSGPGAPVTGDWRRLPEDPRRRLILAALAAAAVFVGGIGYLAATRDSGGGPIPVPTEAAALPAAPPDDSPAPPASSEGPAEEPTQEPADPPEQTRPPATSRPPEGARRPRQIGPDNLKGFQALLTGFCRDNGDQAAVLLSGKDKSAADGTWFCARAVAFTRIDLDDACRDEFGGRAQARQVVRGDARTFRCFDA